MDVLLQPNSQCIGISFLFYLDLLPVFFFFLFQSIIAGLVEGLVEQELISPPTLRSVNMTPAALFTL